MIDIDEVLERLSNGAEDVICKEYELRPQKIAELTKSVAEKTEKQGYVIIGMGNKDNGYSINGINSGIDIESLVNLALQQIHSKIRAEYQIFSLEGKRICVIGVERYIDDKKQLSSEIKKETREKVFKDLLNACIKLQKNNTFINVSEDQRNDFIRDILETSGYQIKDQTRQGKSASGKSSGEIDILLHDHGNPISIIEALNLNGLLETYLDEHIDLSTLGWGGQIHVLKFGCILIMARCQLLWNLGYAAVSLKGFLKKIQDRGIQSQIWQCMKKSSEPEMKKKHFK